jgi:hypothetical protein
MRRLACGGAHAAEIRIAARDSRWSSVIVRSIASVLFRASSAWPSHDAAGLMPPARPHAGGEYGMLVHLSGGCADGRLLVLARQVRSETSSAAGS